MHKKYINSIVSQVIIFIHHVNCKWH